jgi:hypothetical protein
MVPRSCVRWAAAVADPHRIALVDIDGVGLRPVAARVELDPGRALQEAMMSAMKAQSPPAALSPEDISDHFAELAATLDNDPFAIYAELATTAAAFPAEHHAAIAGVLAMSDSEAVREAALGFAFSPDPAASSAALVAVSQQGRGRLVSSKVIDRLVRMRAWLFRDAPGQYRHRHPCLASEGRTASAG